MRSAKAFLLVLGLTAVALAACGGAATVVTATPGATQTVTPTATAAPTTSSSTTAASGKAWTITAASKAVVSVRERLVGVSLPSDAVLTATGGVGTFQLNADGTFTGDSKITFDLNTLASDNRDRDNFVKQDTLQVRQFPRAEFVPTKTTGLATPLAANGSFTFKLIGNLTIHGKTKEVTFDVIAKRAGSDLTATATLNPSVKFGDFGMTAPTSSFRVVSIVDEIRLVVDLVATGAAA